MQTLTSYSAPKKTSSRIGFLPFGKILILVLCLLPVPAHADVEVCSTCTFTSISGALGSGLGNVIVHPGTYTEFSIVVRGLSLTSLSDDRLNTIIESNITVDGRTQPVTIRGFTIRATDFDAISGQGGPVFLQNLIIENAKSFGIDGSFPSIGEATDYTITDSIIRNNRGGIAVGGSRFTLIDSEVLNNTTSGGISAGAFGGGFLHIINSIISGNKALSPAIPKGGGIDAAETTILDNVTVQNNVAIAAFEGNISLGGGLNIRNLTPPAKVTINGGTFSGNSAGRGGGIYIDGLIDAGTAFDGISVISNTATDSGGGIFCNTRFGPVSVPMVGDVSGNSPDDIVGCDVVPLPSTDPVDNSTEGSLNDGKVADPISTFSGELFDEYVTDINLGGPMPLVFRRYYASFLRRSFILGDLGSNWRHNFDARLNISGNTGRYISNKGRVTNFLKNLITDAWEQQDNLDTPYQLSLPGGQDAILYDPVNNRIYTFDFTTSSVIIGKLVKVEDGKGNVHTVSYELTGGQIQTISDGLGRTLTFTYNADTIPKISLVNDGTRSVVYQYIDGIDTEYLTQVTDARGGFTTYSYKDTSANADHALILSTTYPRLNVPYSQTFNTLGQVATQTDSNGNATTLGYAGADTIITDALINNRVHTHTATGELSTSKDQAGLDINIGSDVTGRRNVITDRLGDTTSYGFHAASGNLSGITHADGNSSNFTYSPRPVGALTLYDLTGITHADGSSEILAYDPVGNLISHTDQLGNIETFSYNGVGQVLIETNKLGGTTDNIYNGDGTLANSTDPAGNATIFDYDPLLRPTLIARADTSAVSLTYDNANLLLTSTDENNNATTLTYDLNGKLKTLQNPLLNTTSFSYDGNDRLLSVTDPLGGVSSLSYDQFGRLSTTTDANGNVVTLGYDALGQLTSLADPLGNVWQSSYNAEAILTSSSDPLGNTFTFISDPMGRITQATSPLGNISSISYDAMGHAATTTDALGLVTLISRDARGWISDINLPGGTVKASYTRNALGQITSVTDPNSNNWLRSYDSSGRLISSTDPLARVKTTTYDNRNLPLVITFPGALGTQTISHDGVGNLIGVAYSDGTTLGFTYDANDHLTAANSGGLDDVTRGYDNNNRIINSNGIAVIRDARGRITSMTLAVGKSVTYAYDASNRLTSVADWNGGVTTFDYDVAGRITGINRPNGVNATRTYDNESHLTGLSEGSTSSIGLTLDAKGQITTAVRNVPELSSALALNSSSLTFDAASQVSGASYDEAGRLTAAGANSFTWNLASHLQSYTVGGDTITNTYDALGRRISRIANAVTRNYVWNDALGLPSISVEVEASVDQKYYIHTPEGALLYSMDAVTDARIFYHFDEMGNTIFISDDAGLVIGSYAYTPFGQLLSSSGGLDNPYTWQGKTGVMDEGNGLFYHRTRFFDSSTGRFISRDSIKAINPLEVNPYQYALANPLKYVDFTGMESRWVDTHAFYIGSHRLVESTGKGVPSKRSTDPRAYHGIDPGYFVQALVFMGGYPRGEDDVDEYLASIRSEGPSEEFPVADHPQNEGSQRYAYLAGYQGDVVLLPFNNEFNTISNLPNNKEANIKHSVELPAETKEEEKCDSIMHGETIIVSGLEGLMYFMFGVPLEVMGYLQGEELGKKHVPGGQGCSSRRQSPGQKQTDKPTNGIKSVIPELAHIVVIS